MGGSGKVGAVGRCQEIPCAGHSCCHNGAAAGHSKAYQSCL